MHAIEANRLVDAWEQGQGQHPLYRALTLLRIGQPEQDIGALSSLAIGERDWRLLELRRRIFGDRFDAVATCGQCRERLELSFTAHQLPSWAPVPASNEMEFEGRTIVVRAPTTADLLDAAAAPPEHRVAVMLERCGGADVPESAAGAIDARVAELDPMARIELQLTCPACRHRWISLFDIASYLWNEIGDRAMRLLRETHTLARAYGWSESEILSLSARRRQIYLDMAMGA